MPEKKSFYDVIPKYVQLNFFDNWITYRERKHLSSTKKLTIPFRLSWRVDKAFFEGLRNEIQQWRTRTDDHMQQFQKEAGNPNSFPTFSIKYLPPEIKARINEDFFAIHHSNRKDNRRRWIKTQLRMLNECLTDDTVLDSIIAYLQLGPMAEGPPPRALEEFYFHFPKARSGDAEEDLKYKEHIRLQQVAKTLETVKNEVNDWANLGEREKEVAMQYLDSSYIKTKLFFGNSIEAAIENIKESLFKDLRNFNTLKQDEKNKLAYGVDTNESQDFEWIRAQREIYRNLCQYIISQCSEADLIDELCDWPRQLPGYHRIHYLDKKSILGVLLLEKVERFINGPQNSQCPSLVDDPESANLINKGAELDYFFCTTSRLPENLRQMGGKVLLSLAIERRDDKAMYALLKAGADANANSGVTIKDGTCQSLTPLYYAVQAGSVEAINALLQAGAHLNVNNQVAGSCPAEPGALTPLCWAIKADQINIITLLLDNGADVAITLKNIEEGVIACHHPEVIALLEEHVVPKNNTAVSFGHR